MSKFTINRRMLIARHNPVIREVVPLAPLSVGNGEFAFTADITGLQTFPEQYELPLGTQSQWGWHSSGGRNVWTLDDVGMQLRGDDGKGGYPLHPEDRAEAFLWLRQNPHRLHLAQIGFLFYDDAGETLGIAAVSDIEQTLDQWSGILTSRYLIDGVPVLVRTVCHPELDQLAVFVDSPLIAAGRLAIEIRFPAPGMVSQTWGRSIALNWGDDGSHSTKLTQLPPDLALFTRSMDDDGYRVALHWSEGELMPKEETAHGYVLRPAQGRGERFELTAAFLRADATVRQAGAEETLRASTAHWQRFWQEGGVVELADSRDPRAAELERRIVQSQFLTAIHCAGSTPPQETGLLYNSWFGKFHLEMHWWHAFHFPLWGRAELLRRSMGWYSGILPEARELARSQGYEGARWPKMVAPDAVQSPSEIGPLLIWQQPHPIALAELCYRADPTEATLREFADVVRESAVFMASFAEWDEGRWLYVLGPPVIPAQERHSGSDTWNPTYELEYWRHGLELACRWMRRLGEEPDPKWGEVIGKLSSLPVAEGVYLAHENCPSTYTEKNTDHPSMLGALGMLPGKLVNRETMRATLQKVIDVWNWETTWGWDYPLAAMTAARLGEGGCAVDLLLMDVTKNTYLPNGHNYQKPGLTAYLPGNGGLLTAIAMMACGWEGAPDRHAPGFPDDGSWTVRWEGLNPWM